MLLFTAGNLRWSFRKAFESSWFDENFLRPIKSYNSLRTQTNKISCWSYVEYFFSQYCSNFLREHTYISDLAMLLKLTFSVYLNAPCSKYLHIWYIYTLHFLFHESKVKSYLPYSNEDKLHFTCLTLLKRHKTRTSFVLLVTYFHYLNSTKTPRASKKIILESIVF